MDHLPPTMRSSYRRRPLVTALLLVLAAPALAAPPAPTAWKPNLEVFGQASDRRVGGGFELLAPLWQDARMLAFVEARAGLDDQGNRAFNLGLGLRWLDAGRGFISGLHAHYDRTGTDWSNEYHALTIGAEVLGPVDLRLSRREVFSDAERVHGWVDGIRFRDFRTYTQESFEEPLSGWDGEVGVALPTGQLETRLFAGGYTLEGDLNGNTAGWRARLEVRPTQRLTLEAAVQDDPWFGDQWTLGVRYAFGQPSGRGPRPLAARMNETTRRAIAMPVTPPDITPLQPVVLHRNSIHIDNVRGSADGDGSFERPYRELAQCRAGRCAATVDGTGGSGALVRVWQGQGPYPLTVPWRLLANQAVWGEGWQVAPAVTRQPDYRNWLDRGGFDAARAPLLVATAGDAPADGAILLLTDGIGVLVTTRADAMVAPSALVGPGAPTLNLAVDWSLPDGTPIQGRVLDNLVTATPTTGDLPTDGAALALVNRVTDGSERHQVVLYRDASVPVGTAAAFAGPTALTLTGLSAENQAAGAGSRAVQTIALLGAQVDLTGGIRLHNEASAGGYALQQVRITDGGFSGSGPVAISNLADGGVALQQVRIAGDASIAGLALDNAARDGGRAEQAILLERVTIDAPTAGANGIAIHNRADSGATATQGVALTGAQLALPAQSAMIDNAAVGGGVALQQLEITASGTLARLDLLNEARGGGGATQQVELAGFDLGGASAGTAWVGIGNGAFGAGSATQAVRLRDVALALPGPGGLFVGSGAYQTGAVPDAAVADQQVRIDARGGSVGWLSAFNQVAGGGASVQRLTAAGFGVAAAAADQGGVEVGNSAFAGYGTQQVTLTLTGLDLPAGALVQRNHAEGLAQASQALRLAPDGAVHLARLALDNRAVGASADARQDAALRLGDGLWLGQQRLDNQAEGGGQATQQARMTGGDAGRLGDLLANNRAQDASGAVQILVGELLPLLTDQPTDVGDPDATARPSRLAADNQAGVNADARQSLQLTGRAAAMAGRRALLLGNQADAGGTAGQWLDLAGGDAPGQLGPVALGNQAGSGATASQRVRLATDAVAAGYVAAVASGASGTPGAVFHPALAGIRAVNQGDGGGAAQTLTIDAGAAGLTATALALTNTGSAAALANQAVTLTAPTATGDLGWLAVSNDADTGADAVQTLVVDGPLPGLDGLAHNLGNQAGSGALANQQIDLHGAFQVAIQGAIQGAVQDRGSDPRWLTSNQSRGGQALQRLRLTADGPLPTTPLHLEWSNAADGGSALQTASVDGPGLPPGALAVHNRADLAGEAGQVIAVTGPEPDATAPGGALTITNDAVGGALAEQAVRLRASGIAGETALANQATAAVARQGLDLRLGLLDGALRVTSTAAEGGTSAQTLALASIGGSGAATLDAIATAGGATGQWLTFAGLRRTAGSGPALHIGADATGATTNQVIELLGAMLAAGPSPALSIEANTAAAADVTQQVTLRDNRIVGAGPQVQVQPNTPVAGRVGQHLALWSTPVAVRFEPAVIHSLEELAGLTQTLHIDGVRQTIWRWLIGPDGTGTWIGDGDGGDGGGPGDGGGNWSGGVTIIGTNPGGLIAIDPRPLNFGDLFGGPAGDLVHGLGLPATAALPPGALAYLRDLRARRGDPPVGGGGGLVIGGGEDLVIEPLLVP